MAVTSRPTRPPRIDASLLASRAGLALTIIIFGGLLWAINGGFSVLGLEKFASSFNAAGLIFWSIISAWRFSIPQIPYLPSTQPVIPWLGVLAASILQIATIYRKLRDLEIPRWMLFSALAISLYDLATTYYGLSAIAWLESSGNVIQALIAIVLTFTFETVVSFGLKEVSTWKQAHE